MGKLSNKHFQPEELKKAQRVGISRIITCWAIPNRDSLKFNNETLQ